MSQQEIEVILARHLAEHLAFPIFIVGPDGGLIFYNEPAEKIIGLRYEETGPMPASEWSTIFEPADLEGNPLIPEELPLMIAMAKRHPVHKGICIRGMDGVLRQIESTAFPLVVQADRFLGAIAFFWEVPQ